VSAGSRRGWASGLSVVVAAAIGVVTNLVTNQWSLALAATLLLLIVSAVVIQVFPSRAPAEPAPGQHATASDNAVVIQAGRDVVNPDQR
jgi:uncharacterized membrane protein YhiD involved in acid resistance